MKRLIAISPAENCQKSLPGFSASSIQRIKSKSILLAALLTLPCAIGFSQTCPCVKTQIIGNNARAGFIHNNAVKAMRDTTVAMGTTVLLRTLSCVGQASWYIKGSSKALDNPIVSPATDTDYVVKSNLAGCPPVYDTVRINVLASLHKETDEDVIFLYPNPSTEKITVVTAHKPIHKIQLIDMRGTTVLTITPSEHSSAHTLNISNLPAATYFVKIYAANYLYTKKLIKH
jgi:hypothetical protein